MATIIVEDVPESIVKIYGTKIKFNYNLFKKENHELEWTEY